MLGPAVLEYLHCAAVEFGKDGMLAGLPKPVPGVPRVGFHSVDDGVPITPLRAGYVLGNSMTLIPASKAK